MIRRLENINRLEDNSYFEVVNLHAAGWADIPWESLAGYLACAVVGAAFAIAVGAFLELRQEVGRSGSRHGGNLSCFGIDR